ncbi:MAG: hypothetical protein ACR2QG_12950 [Gammaproteobacteria bacterium]
MSNSEFSALWKRLAIEGPIIIISILLAFAIDAWWDDRKQRSSAIEQLKRVATEMVANEQYVETKIQTLEDAVEGSAAIMTWMGPQPVEAPLPLFDDHWTDTLSIGFLELQRSATSDILARGQLASEDMNELRTSLLDWSAWANSLEQQYAMLREEHSQLMDEVRVAVPMWSMTYSHPLLADFPKPRFPLDLDDFLGNPHIEGQLGLYALRLKFSIELAEGFKSAQTEIVNQIELIIEE